VSQSFTFNFPADSYLYTVDLNGVVTDKAPMGDATGGAGVSYTITQASDDGSFATGDVVQIDAVLEGEAFPIGTGTVIGVTKTGVLLRIGDQDSAAYMTTDLDESYNIGNSIPYSTDPEVTFSVCFVRGTMIETSAGAVAIEHLVPGDQVRGSTGWRTVKWIGWRNYGAFELRTSEQKARCAPVRIHKHALGDNQPAQDLFVSPWHHLYIDGVLVRANDLINGITITQETHMTSVSYYHVELDQFDVVLAHGVYSESWADGGNRDFFQNVDVTTLRPEDQKRRMADRPGFKALRKQQDIAPIHGRIAQRADRLRSEQCLLDAA